MSKNEFMNELEFFLSDFSKEERDEILYDYEEHFRVGREKGKSDEELISELGNPRDIANQYRSSSDNYAKNEKSNDNMFTSRRSILEVMLILIGLMFLTLLLIGPYLGVAGAIIGLAAGAVSMVIAGLAAFIGAIFQPLFPQFISMPSGISHIAVMLMGIGTIALGLLACIGMFYLVKGFIKISMNYINWVIRKIKG